MYVIGILAQQTVRPGGSISQSQGRSIALKPTALKCWAESARLQLRPPPGLPSLSARDPGSDQRTPEYYDGRRPRLGLPSVDARYSHAWAHCRFHPNPCIMSLARDAPPIPLLSSQSTPGRPPLDFIKAYKGLICGTIVSLQSLGKEGQALSRQLEVCLGRDGWELHRRDKQPHGQDAQYWQALSERVSKPYRELWHKTHPHPPKEEDPLRLRVLSWLGKIPDPPWTGDDVHLPDQTPRDQAPKTSGPPDKKAQPGELPAEKAQPATPRPAKRKSQPPGDDERPSKRPTPSKQKPSPKPAKATKPATTAKATTTQQTPQPKRDTKPPPREGTRRSSRLAAKPQTQN